jgi:hypothetical protein
MVIMGKTLTTGKLDLDQLGITPGITNFQEMNFIKNPMKNISFGRCCIKG